MLVIPLSVREGLDLAAAIATLLGLPTIVGALWAYGRPIAQRIVRRGIKAKPLGLDSGYRGLILLVSAPMGAKMTPTELSDMVDHSPQINDALRASPIGAALKAMELHTKDLEDCWLLSSTDSEPYRKILEQAYAKYYPSKRLHVPKPVIDVYRKIDEVYERTHQIFNSCGADTGGALRPSDIITDVTGGTKIMSIAVAMACLDADRQLQYIEQEQRRDFYEIDVTWETITRRPS